MMRQITNEDLADTAGALLRGSGGGDPLASTFFLVAAWRHLHGDLHFKATATLSVKGGLAAPPSPLELGAFQEFYTDSDNVAPNGTVNYTFPTQESHLTNASLCIDGDPTTYFLLQPHPEIETDIMIDLGAVYKVMSIEIRFASFGGDTYFASRFTTLMGITNQNFDMFQVDQQQGSRVLVHYVQVYRLGRFVRFVFDQVFGLNPDGRLGIEDFIVRKVSDNLALRSGVTTDATTSWANCIDCQVVHGTLWTLEPMGHLLEDLQVPGDLLHLL
ncbi:unnamed protein product [Symbiodinium natans]|uniref:F5/8 type C domain-containing protein n=1 Tax=Symbiodinium natans TaxID=878477 RepID=A0A812TZS5_9DINO|nr:unnamed protein product [Symbiodinium natans]